jgi:biotin-(acetyl-CoA carboxylase) ligase
MADEKKINISIGAGINVSSEEHSTYIEIRKFHQSTLELPYEPTGVNLDKASLNKLIKLSEELMTRIES